MKVDDQTLSLRAELMLLRIFAVAPLLFLGVSLLIDFAHRGYFLDSISAYYGSPVRDVFVGSLVALGLVYVIYRGSTDLEDRALDLAGFFAVVVALVPHNYEALLLRVEEPIVARDTLVGVLTAWLVISAVFYAIQGWWRRWVNSPFARRSALQELLYSLPWVGFVIFGTVWIIAGQPFDTVHFVAAVLVVLCLIVVVANHAFGNDNQWVPLRTDPRVRAIYSVIALWMFAGLVLGAVLHYVFDSTRWILITEFVEIGAFLAFWVVNLVVAGLAIAKEVRAASRPQPESVK